MVMTTSSSTSVKPELERELRELRETRPGNGVLPRGWLMERKLAACGLPRKGENGWARGWDWLRVQGVT